MESIGDDLLQGVKDIAAFIKETPQRANYMCARGYIPAFKLGDRWHMRKSTYLAHLAKLEAAAQRERVVA